MLISISLLVFGFVLLLKGADFLILGAKKIAQRFHVSSLVIGLSLVAFGTSAPEMAVNLVAGFEGKGDLVMGNIIGSNIANIALALGVAVFLMSVKVSKGTVFKETPLSFLAGLCVLVLGWDTIFNGSNHSFLSRGDGVILIFFFVIFLYYLFALSKAKESLVEEIDEDGKSKPPLLYASAMFLVGLVGIVFGGKLVVTGGIMLGTLLGLSEAFVGLTITALGTSLPEVVTAVVAVYRREHGIAIGNIIGSNIFNIFLVLGITATLFPFTFSSGLIYDLGIMLTITFVLFLFMLFGRKLGRKSGVVLLLSYASYLVFLVFRG